MLSYSEMKFNWWLHAYPLHFMCCTWLSIVSCNFSRHRLFWKNRYRKQMVHQRQKSRAAWYTHTHTHTHTFNGPFSRTTQVSRYRKGKTNLDFTEARDSELAVASAGRMQVCTSLQTDNHASTPPLSFLQAGCPYCHPTNSVKALKAKSCMLVRWKSHFRWKWSTDFLAIDMTLCRHKKIFLEGVQNFIHCFF